MTNSAKRKAKKAAIKLSPGGSYTDASIPGFKITCLTKQQKKALPTDKAFLLELSKPAAKDLRLKLGLSRWIEETQTEVPVDAENARGAKKKYIYPAIINGVPTEINIPVFPRWLLGTFEECLDQAKALSDKNIPGTVNTGPVSAKVYDDFHTVATFVQKEKIDIKQAAVNEFKRRKRVNMPLRELITKKGRSLGLNKDGEFFRLDHEKKWEQYPPGAQLNRAKVYFELYEAFPNAMADDITDTAAEIFLYGVSAIREARDVYRHRGVNDPSLLTIAITLSAIFTFGKERNHCSTNPFLDLCAEISKRLKAAKAKRGPREPLTIEQVAHLIKTCWEIDRPMLVPLSLQMWAGLRRVELFRTTWECINLQTGYIEVLWNMVKVTTPTRFFWVFLALKTIFDAFPLQDPSTKLVTISKAEYQRRFRIILDAAGLGHLGKDGLRKNFTICHQHIGTDHTTRQFVVGNYQGSRTTDLSYNGKATHAWAVSFATITLTEMLGFNPGPQSIPPLVSITGTGYTTNCKTYQRHLAGKRRLYRQHKLEKQAHANTTGKSPSKATTK